MPSKPPPERGRNTPASRHDAVHHSGGIIEPRAEATPILQCEYVISREQVERLSKSATRATTAFGGGMIALKAESRVERIRRLQDEADAAVGQMVWEVNEKLMAIQKLLSEITECGSNRPGVQSLVQELKPQIDRLQGITQGVGNRQSGV